MINKLHCLLSNSLPYDKPVVCRDIGLDARILGLCQSQKCAHWNLGLGNNVQRAARDQPARCSRTKVVQHNEIIGLTCSTR